MPDIDETDDIAGDIAKAFADDAGEVVAQATIPDPEETASEKAERVRDEQGRFAKTDEAGQDTEASAQEPAKTILPPRSWTAAAKAKFATLDPDVQQEVLRRESEIDAGKAQWDTKAEQFNRLDAALSKVRDRYRLAGLTDDQYVGALVQADEMLRGPNALQALQTLAQQYGINLSQIVPQQFGGPPQPAYGQPDPQIYSLQQQLQSLQATVESRAKAEEAQAQAQVVQQIEAFASDPKHIYFDNVRQDMAVLLQAKPELTLAEAYDRACNADPTIRQLIAASGSKPATPTKPAGLSVTGAQKGARPPPPAASNGNSIEDDVRAAMQELQAGAI